MPMQETASSVPGRSDEPLALLHLGIPSVSLLLPQRNNLHIS